MVEKLAAIKGVSKEEIIRETTKNARALYRITEQEFRDDQTDRTAISE